MENFDNIDYLKPRLLAVLKKLLNTDFRVSDDTIMDKLYSHIENSKSLNDTIHSLEIVEWLDTVLSKCTSEDIYEGVRIFAVRLTGHVGSTIIGFNALRSKYTLNHLVKLIANSVVNTDFCILVPLIKDIGKFINHEEGWKWVTETLIWKDAIKVLNEEKSIYVKRAGISLASLLLMKSMIYDKKAGLKILLQICEPLIRNNLLYIEQFIDNDTPGISNACEYGSTIISVTDLPNVLRCAKCLCSILEDILANGEAIPAKLCLKFQNTSSNRECILMTDFLQTCSSNENHQHLSLLIIMVHLTNAFGKYNGDNDLDTCSLTLFHSDVYWIIESMSSQRHFNALMNVCVASLSGQFKANHKKRNCTDTCHDCSGFERSIVYCLMAFLHLHHSCYAGTDISPYAQKMKIDSIPNENSTYGENLFKRLLKECQEDEEKTTKLSIQYIQWGVLGVTRSLNYITCLKNKQYIFSNTLNTLDSMVNLLKAGHSEGLVIPILVNLIALTSKVIEIPLIPIWTTSYSCSKHILRTLHNVLSIDNNCDNRVIISSLQLLNKTLRFHMFPELLQRSEIIPDKSVIIHVFNFSLLFHKLSDPSWEVRDTTLEVFQTMIDLAGLVPWLFIDIFQALLLNKILDIAHNDEFAYVRTSALNFFSKGVRGGLFEAFIKRITLMELALKTLKTDEMPAPRRAACDLITALYINCESSLKECENEIFEAIYFTSVNELDWEVKNAALAFWHCTINKLLTTNMVPLELEMCDSLKYSNVSEEGIRSQLPAIFETLGSTGCLKAIWLGLNDECDLTVAKEAQKIVDHLERLDQQWKYIEDILNSPGLEEISENDTTVPHKLKAKDFFELLRKQDWRERLSSRQNWVENKSDDLISLLDHILYVDNNIGELDHNSIDCY